MSQELQLLLDVHRRLTEVRIPYMLTGSLAMNFYVEPRMTRDIDLVVALFEPLADVIANAFKNDFYADAEMIRQAIRSETMFNLIHNQSLIKIDFVIRKKTDYRLLEFSRRKTVPVSGVEISVVSPEDLILSKLEWAKESRSKTQFADIKNLLKLSDLDKNYLEEWTQNLGLANIYEEAIRS